MLHAFVIVTSESHRVCIVAFTVNQVGFVYDDVDSKTPFTVERSLSTILMTIAKFASLRTAGDPR